MLVLVFEFAIYSWFILNIFALYMRAFELEKRFEKEHMEL